MPVKAYKTKISYGSTTDPTTATWTAFANVIDVKPPKIKADDIDSTVLDSPDEFKQSMPGFAEGGESEATIQFEKTLNATVYGLFRQQSSFQIMFPDGPPPSGAGSNWAFGGYINGFANEVEKEKLVTADVTIKVTGKPIFTPAGS